MNPLLPLWAVVVALLLLALAGLLWPLLREPSLGGPDAESPEAGAQDEHLRRLYRVKREELEREYEHQNLSTEDRAQALEELERRLLEELDAPAAGAGGAHQRPLRRSSPWLRRLPAAVVSILLPVSALGLYVQVGDPLAAATLASAPPDTHTVGGSDVDGMVAKLEERLRHQPDDLEGWLVLARSREVMEDFQGASGAYQRALDLAAKLQAPATFRARLNADLADVLASARDGKLDAPVQAVLQAALALDPDQPKALALAGTAAVRQGDLIGARTHWRRLLALLEPGSDLALRVQSDLDTLEDKPQGVRPTDARAAASTAPSREPTKQTAGLTGIVRLDPALRDRVQPGDTVFIVVRTPSMGRMPVGLLRLTAAQLPAEFELDDRHAMSPDAPLSKFTELSIEVRISRSGTPQRRPGEPISRPLEARAGATGLVLLVDSLEPQAVRGVVGAPSAGR